MAAAPETQRLSPPPTAARNLVKKFGSQINAKFAQEVGNFNHRVDQLGFAGFFRAFSGSGDKCSRTARYGQNDVDFPFLKVLGQIAKSVSKADAAAVSLHHVHSRQCFQMV